jgi:hypothetical protein
MLLIGSRAIQYWLPDWREPLDVDLVGTYDEIEAYRKRNNIKVFYPINEGKTIFMRDSEGVIHEAEIAWEGSRAEKLIKFVEGQSDNGRVGQGMIVPSLDVLLLLKMSHRYLKDSPHHFKTMDDIFALRKAGAKIREEHKEFLADREKDTYIHKTPKLNVKKGEFFAGDGINYEWEHDDIHQALKFMDQPAYLYYAGGEVWSDMSKFKQCSREIQLYGVLEECLTLAAERSQLCFNPRPDPDWSFKFALGKVTSSICGGYFREFAWENAYAVMELYEKEGKGYMDKVDEAIKNGIIQRTKQKEAA